MTKTAEEYFASKNGGKPAEEADMHKIYFINKAVVLMLEEYAKQQVEEKDKEIERLSQLIKKAYEREELQVGITASYIIENQRLGAKLFTEEQVREAIRMGDEIVLKEDLDWDRKYKAKKYTEDEIIKAIKK